MKSALNPIKLLFLVFISFFINIESVFCQEIVLDTLIHDEENISIDDSVKVYTYKIKGKTASGRWTTKIKVPFVAISPDLIDKYPLGSRIELYDCNWKGRYFVMDIMGQKNLSTVDVFYNGKRKNVCFCKIRPAETD